MIRVYSHPDPSITALVRNAIEQIGVPAVVQGERPGAALGEIPPIAAWSEVWVPDDDRLADVAAVVAEVTAEPDETAEPWDCAVCAETLEASFGACWSCGTPRPDDAQNSALSTPSS